jgi:hypothetical protein
LLRKKAAAIVVPRGVVVEEEIIGVQDSSPATIEKSFSSWMEIGYTRPDGGCGKWKFSA